jgi:hypothetical protein
MTFYGPTTFFLQIVTCHGRELIVQTQYKGFLLMLETFSFEGTNEGLVSGPVVGKDS